MALRRQRFKGAQAITDARFNAPSFAPHAMISIETPLYMYSLPFTTSTLSLSGVQIQCRDLYLPWEVVARTFSWHIRPCRAIS